MNKIMMLEKLRFYLADPAGKIWKDDLLNDILEEALKQYSADSGAFTGRFDFYPDENGIYHYPEDFFSFIIAWNSDGQEIMPATAKDLFDRKHFSAIRKGNAQYIFDDQNTLGSFCTYPRTEQNTEDITIDGFYGEVSDAGYGVFLDRNYGVTLSVKSFDFAGEIFYCRIGNFEEIKDYSAVIYYALFLAYNSDADFGNADNAAIWFNRYKDRISRFAAISDHNTGQQRSVNFY